MSKEKCTMDSLCGDCQCSECDGYGDVFNAVWDMPHEGKRVDFIDAVMSHTGQSKKRASRYVYILEDTGVISFTGE